MCFTLTIPISIAFYAGIRVQNIQKVLGYVAKPYTKDVIEDTEQLVIRAIMDGSVTTKEYIQYLNNIQWFN